MSRFEQEDYEVEVVVGDVEEMPRVVYQASEPRIIGVLGQGRGANGRKLPSAVRIGYYRGAMTAWQLPEIHGRDLSSHEVFKHLMEVY